MEAKISRHCEARSNLIPTPRFVPSRIEALTHFYLSTIDDHKVLTSLSVLKTHGSKISPLRYAASDSYRIEKTTNVPRISLSYTPIPAVLSTEAEKSS